MGVENLDYIFLSGHGSGSDWGRRYRLHWKKAYFSGLNFVGYPHNSYGQKYGTVLMYLHFSILEISHWIFLSKNIVFSKHMKCWCGLSEHEGEIIPDAEKCCPDINIENVVLSNIRIRSVFQFRIQSFQSLGFRSLGWLRVLGFRLRRFWKSQSTGPSGQLPGAWPKSYAPNLLGFLMSFLMRHAMYKTWGLPSGNLT